MSREVIDWKRPEIAVIGGGVFPLRHAWCVGRNYAEHAREMGADPERSSPIFFSKPAAAVVNAERIDFPEATAELHHEVELVVVLRAGGRHLDTNTCRRAVFGYCVGVDLTRRDVQARAKKAGHPWEMSKGFDQSAPVGQILPATDWQPEADHRIELMVNDELRQRAVLGDMIWPVAELLSRLSGEVTLRPGDAIFTGTPAGVGPLLPGDKISARIDGLPALEFSIIPVS